MNDAAAVMAMSGYRRFFTIEIVVNAIISAGFGGLFGWLLFGTNAVVTPTDKYWLSLDFLPQTFMTALMSYLIPGVSARLRLRKGRLERLSSPISRVNDLPFVGQVVVAAVLTTATIGIAAASVTQMLVETPVSNARVMAAKMTYGAILSVGIAAFALFAALAPGRSGEHRRR